MGADGARQADEGPLEYFELLLRLEPHPGPGRDLVIATWVMPGDETTSVTTVFADDIFDHWAKQSGLWEARSRGMRSFADATHAGSGSAVFRDIVPRQQIHAPWYQQIAGFLDDMGKEMWERLGSQRVRSCWRVAYERALRAAEKKGHARPRIRLVLLMDHLVATRLAAVPYETMRVTPGTLLGIQECPVTAAGVSVVRRITGAEAVRPGLAVGERPLRVLVFVPSTGEEAALDTNQEIRAIRDAQQSLGDDVVLDIVDGPKATLGGLRSRCQDGRRVYHAFHFIGHGRTNDQGRAELKMSDGWKPDGSVVELLEEHGVRLLFLNGCETAAMSVLACHFPAVIGMQFKISDVAATKFARALYRELALSGQIDLAVEKGRSEIVAAARGVPQEDGTEYVGDWEFRTPVLYLQPGNGLLMKVKPRFSEITLPAGCTGEPYEGHIQVEGGRPPFSWGAIRLPGGLSYRLDARDASCLCIDGVPTAASVGVSYPFVVTSADGVVSKCELRIDIEGGGLRPL